MELRPRDELLHGAEAVWRTGPEGRPTVTLGRMGPMRAEPEGPFGFRFMREELAPSPEDLLAAAHVSCYATSLTSVLRNRGLEVRRVGLRSVCVMRPDSAPGIGWRVHEVVLEVHAEGELTRAELDEARQVADQICPVSKAISRSVPVRWRGTV